ncbi:MAG: hypothetical protein ACRD04_04070 [Terriglobales bacterium]
MRSARFGLLVFALAGVLGAQTAPRTIFRDACTNTARIRSLGAQPVEPYLQSVAALQDPHQVAAALAELHRFGAFAAFRVGGQPVPPRIRDYATQRYAQHLFSVLGDPAEQAAAEARTAINMEIGLLPPPSTAPPQALTLQQLDALTPNVDWTAYWATLGAPATATLATSPAALRLLNARLLFATMDQWRSYLRWCWLRSTAALLGPRFVSAHFAFLGQRAPTRAVLCQAVASEFPARAFADVPLTRSDYFGDVLHLRAWKARQQWLRR